MYGRAAAGFAGGKVGNRADNGQAVGGHGAKADSAMQGFRVNPCGKAGQQGVEFAQVFCMFLQAFAGVQIIQQITRANDARAIDQRRGVALTANQGIQRGGVGGV